MGLAHFAEGAGEDHLHLLGVSAPRNVNSEANRLYDAELGTWKNGGRLPNGWVQTDPEASKTISLNGARDLVGEAIHHPAMDVIPGIENVRANYNPKTDVVFTKRLNWKNSEGKKETTGAMVTDERSWAGKPNRLLINSKLVGPAMDVGGITHEASHMITHGLGTLGHNWAMARLHIHLARNVLGDASANALIEHYNKHGVDFGGKGI